LVIPFGRYPSLSIRDYGLYASKIATQLQSQIFPTPICQKGTIMASDNKFSMPSAEGLRKMHARGTSRRDYPRSTARSVGLQSRGGNMSATSEEYRIIVNIWSRTGEYTIVRKSCGSSNSGKEKGSDCGRAVLATGVDWWSKGPGTIDG
jgi:hypothetical protein